MKLHVTRVVTVLSITVALSIATKGWTAPDLDAAAEGACECLKAPYDIARKALDELHKAQGAGDTSRLMLAQGEMMAVIDASSQCFTKLAQTYPEIDASYELKSQVMAKTETLCPNPAAGFMQTR